MNTPSTSRSGGTVSTLQRLLETAGSSIILSSIEREALYVAIAALSEMRAWQPIATAPKDGTLLLLLIGPDDARTHPLEDTADGSRTIGQNNFENDGMDKWEFAGWCWSHDHYTQGEGSPTHWQRLPEATNADER